jgi:capsid assembly protease
MKPSMLNLTGLPGGYDLLGGGSMKARDMLGHDLAALDMSLAQPLLSLPVADLAAAAPGIGGQDQRGFTVTRGVAAIGLKGILTANNAMFARYMGWSTYHGLAATCAELAMAEDVEQVVIEADSPGGMVLGIEAGAEAVAALAAQKPVHVLVNPMAASAAYWIAAQATEITLTPGAIVGSIGVGMQTHSFKGPGMLFGEQYYSLTSTNARAKWPDAGTDEGMAELQRSLDQTESRFHAAVASGRGIAAADLAARLSVTDDPRDGGAVFLGADAIGRGLADRLETRAAFYDRLFAGSAGSGRGGAGACADDPLPAAAAAQAASAKARAVMARLISGG